MLLCVWRTIKNKVILKLRWLCHALWTLSCHLSALEVRFINYRHYWELHVNFKRQKQVIREKVNKERWKITSDSLREIVKFALGYYCVYREVLIRRSSSFCQVWWYVVTSQQQTQMYESIFWKIQGRLVSYHLLQTSKFYQWTMQWATQASVSNIAFSLGIVGRISMWGTGGVNLPELKYGHVVVCFFLNSLQKFQSFPDTERLYLYLIWQITRQHKAKTETK